jgi:hypothetical protein
LGVISYSAFASFISEETSIEFKIENADSLPSVFTDRQELLDLYIKQKRLPGSVSISCQIIWMIGTFSVMRSGMLIIESAGIELVDTDLPFDVQETGTITLDGYSIKNIAFQSLPGAYATANLFIPDGEGPFPAVIVMLGHWEEGKLARPADRAYAGPKRVCRSHNGSLGSR